jgi:ankyrin repeat protein
MNLPPPPAPQDDDPIITKFKPVQNQWELTEYNIQRIDPKNGQTIFHNYCEYINTTPLAVYRYLIEVKGCDVNIQDKYNDIPLISALRCFKGGNVTVLTYLLTQKGLNVNIKGKYGHTILHTACTHINKLPLEIFKLLIETLGCDVNAQNKYNDTPLHNALRNFNPNHIINLTYLLTRKHVNVNIKSNYGSTMLHDACERINKLPLEIFKLLIETIGFDVNVQNNSKSTPVHFALCHFNLNYDGDITVLMYLLSREDIKSNYGYTLLHVACLRINNLPLDVFKVLIETHGFDVNEQDDDNHTPLRNSINSFNPNWGGDIKVLTYLLSQKDINANIRGEHGYTLLHYACENVNILPLEIFQLLIETSNADVNARDKYNDTPLHLALRSFNPNDGGEVAVLTYLLSRKSINFDIKGQNDRNLLHWACICDTAPDSDDDFTDSDDDLSDLNDLSDFDDSNNSVEAKGDTLFYPVVEMIVETCLEQILDETRF